MVTEISSCFSVIHRVSRGHAIFFPGFVSVSVQSALSLSINPAQFQLMNWNNSLIIEALINFVPWKMMVKDLNCSLNTLLQLSTLSLNRASVIMLLLGFLSLLRHSVMNNLDFFMTDPSLNSGLSRNVVEYKTQKQILLLLKAKS